MVSSTGIDVSLAEVSFSLGLPNLPQALPRTSRIARHTMSRGESAEDTLGLEVSISGSEADEGLFGGTIGCMTKN
jgi:hypothetical protein